MGNIAILKVSRGDKDKESVRSFATEIGKAIGGVCFLLSHDEDIVLGELAEERLKKFRDRISEALGE